MKIYATRHGETDLNVTDIICGITDIDLNSNGIEQAKQLAQKVLECGDIDIIIASPMKRAMKTAQFIADKIEREIITDSRLVEWNYGNFEGKHTSSEGFTNAKLEFGCKMPNGGESSFQLAHRVYSAIDDIRKKYPDKNVLIVCHGGVCRIIETYFNDMTAEEFANFFMGNCELREYII